MLILQTQCFCENIDFEVIQHLIYIISTQMEQSDAMLISSLKEFITVSEDISTIKDIRTQQIYQIGCTIFEALKIDYTELKQINRAQRFRSMTKLTQIINHQFDSNFDLNDVMNPTLPFLRKLLLAFVSKLGAAEGQRNKAIITQHTEGNEAKYQKQMYKRWLNTQYICPQLRTQKKIKYQSYRLKMQLKKDIFKRNIGSQLATVPGNAQAIIKVMLGKENMERKRREAEEGITRKGQQLERNVHRIVKNNVQDWQKAENTVKKLKKQILKANQLANQETTGGKTKEMSVYQQQVQKIAQQQKKLKGMDDKKTQTRASQIQSIQSDMNPLQRIRRQTENIQTELQNQLNNIIDQISSLKQSIQQKQKAKQKLQDQIQICQQRTTTQRQLRAALKKQVEKQKILLDTIEGDTDITKEVQQLDKEVQYLQKQADKQIVSLENDILNTKKQGQEKIDILKDLKIRLNKIQTDYSKVCEEIQDKNQIKGKVKITKSGLSRLYYSKKISEMEVRWRETQKESKKILQNVAKIREQIRRLQYSAEISQTQIQNASNSSKLRTEAQNLAFKDMFNQCKRTFTRTIQCIEQINATKNQVQEFEMKVHALAGKDYKESTKKVEIALEELKKELREIVGKK